MRPPFGARRNPRAAPRRSFRFGVRRRPETSPRGTDAVNVVSTMPIILMSLLASMSLGSSALAEIGPGPGPEQYTQNCQTSNPRLERLASAIERGEIEYVRAALDEGLDVNETWRDLPAQACRSLLLRSVWYSKDEIFGLLLKRGADPRSLPRIAWHSRSQRSRRHGADAARARADAARQRCDPPRRPGKPEHGDARSPR